jgi:galactoside O-acetyltransferase
MPYTDVEYKFRKIGTNVQIGRNVYFRYPGDVEIGDNVIIDEFSYFTTAARIGSHVHIAPHCSIIGGRASTFVMEDFATLAAGGRVVCGSDSYLGDGMVNTTIPPEYRASVEITTVTIGKHAAVGTGCVIHPGVTIGEGAAVGSMSLVTKDLDPWGVYIGVPARWVRERQREIILEHERNMRLARDRER